MKTSSRFVALAIGISVSLAQTTEPSSDLKSVVGQWVETMQAIQKEESDWQRDREVLENSRASLRSEISQLKEAIADAEKRAETATTEQDELIARRDQLTAFADALAQRVIALEDRMAKLVPLFPDVLRAEPKVATALESFAKTMESPDRSELKGAPGRLQTVLTLQRSLEVFQNVVTLRKAEREASDGRVYEVDVIYLGLARAFTVNEAGTFAEYGAPSPDGWVFTEDNSLAADVRALVESSRGNAAFINIPVTIK